MHIYTLAQEQPLPAEHPPAPAAAAVHHGDLSDRVPPSEVTFEDKIYTLEAMCDLDCGVRGQCLLEKLEKDSLRKRCLCPVGKTGEKCAFGKPSQGLLYRWTEHWLDS